MYSVKNKSFEFMLRFLFSLKSDIFTQTNHSVSSFMSILDKFRSPKTEVNHYYSDGPLIYFGRYTDRNKSREQYESWDKSIALYKEKRYMDAYMEFFNYLNDKEIGNISYENQGNKIVFQLIQGSKIVNGLVNDIEIQAEAEVVRFSGQNIPVMSKLLHKNYDLYFSKFAIKNDLFTLKYFSPVEDAPPPSFYYALKEVATIADYYDDILVDEFDSIETINTEHIEQLPENEKQVKIKYLRKWVEEVIQTQELPETDKFDGIMSYRLLNLAYKIHYLLTPEGKLLDQIIQIQSLFLSNENTLSEKNYLMLEEFKKINQQDDSTILKSFYKIKASFAVAKPTSHQIVSKFILDELNKMNWYTEHKQYNFVNEVCEYIISYSCFSYGMPAIANDLLHIFWRVHYAQFFSDLGFKHLFYDTNTSKLNSNTIKSSIQRILNHSKKRYPSIKFKTNRLNFTNLTEFNLSFIREFCNFNYD